LPIFSPSLFTVCSERREGSQLLFLMPLFPLCLSIVIYDLSHPNPLPWYLGFSIELVALSLTFTIFSPVLVDVFQVLMSSFFIAKSTFLQGSLTPTRHFTVITSFLMSPAAPHSSSHAHAHGAHTSSGGYP
jgi:hypothetical protein